ncbi:MAG: cupin domain-containing protein [Bdellovibrionales bacterium]|nr:cupin domain-containing protein [Bdellovibrionales bacterium]
MPFIEIERIEGKELIPGFEVRFIHSDTMTFAHWNIKAGAILPEHSHHHEQVAHVLEGKFELTIDGRTMVVEPGTVGIIPSNAVHSGRAITDCRILDVFYPIREDYRT